MTSVMNLWKKTSGFISGLMASTAGYAVRTPSSAPLSLALMSAARSTFWLLKMAFFDFPAQHWQSLRTSNPIESTFGTIRHRTKRAKGCLSRNGMLHMMFKLSQCAEKKWRRLRGFDFLAKVITGVKFKDAIEVTKTDQAAA